MDVESTVEVPLLSSNFQYATRSVSAGVQALGDELEEELLVELVDELVLEEVLELVEEDVLELEEVLELVLDDVLELLLEEPPPLVFVNVQVTVSALSRWMLAERVARSTVELVVGSTQVRPESVQPVVAASVTAYVPAAMTNVSL